MPPSSSADTALLLEKGPVLLQIGQVTLPRLVREIPLDRHVPVEFSMACSSNIYLLPHEK